MCGANQLWAGRRIVEVDGKPTPDLDAFINDKLAEAWKANSLQVAPRCDDYEFIRRVSVDIIGRIATVEEIDKYMKDPANNRRALLVDRLLAPYRITSGPMVRIGRA